MKNKSKMSYWVCAVIVILVLVLCSCKQEPVEAEEKLVEEIEEELSEAQSDISDLEEEIASLKEELRSLEEPAEEILEVAEEIPEVEVNISMLSPKVLDTISHDQMIDVLREKFPEAMFRGVEAASFEITSLSEIERFLEEDQIDKEDLGGNKGDYVFRLMGQFSQPNWEKIPVGWAKSDEEIYNIVVVEENSQITVYGIDPMTDKIWEISKAPQVKFVLV